MMFKFTLFLVVMSLLFWTTPCKKDIFKKEIPKKNITCTSRPIVIAVIDTGFGFNNKGKSAKLCQFGHRDFTNTNEYFMNSDTVDPVPKDGHGHGTNIVGVIDRYASLYGTNYCLVILKFWDKNMKVINQTDKTGTEAIRYATDIKADFINFSGGGPGFYKPEAEAVKKYIDNGGTFVAAAGNERNDLEKVPYYPAMDDKRVISVGNLYKNGDAAISSNYGRPVTVWEVGEDVEAYGIVMTGTSQATAVVTGKMVSEIKNCISIK